MKASLGKEDNLGIDISMDVRKAFKIGWIWITISILALVLLLLTMRLEMSQKPFWASISSSANENKST